MFGRNTRAAISGWQRDEALAIAGYLTVDQVRLIRVQTGGGVGYVRMRILYFLKILFIEMPIALADLCTS